MWAGDIKLSLATGEMSARPPAAAAAALIKPGNSRGHRRACPDICPRVSMTTTITAHPLRGFPDNEGSFPAHPHRCRCRNRNRNPYFAGPALSSRFEPSAKHIKMAFEGVVVVILSSYDMPEYRQAAFRNGADCYIAKGSASCMDDVTARVEGTLASKGIVAQRQQRA